MKDQKMMMNISLRTDWSFFLGFFRTFPVYFKLFVCFTPTLSSGNRGRLQFFCVG